MEPKPISGIAVRPEQENPDLNNHEGEAKQTQLQPNTSNVSSSRPEQENPDLNNHEEEAKQAQFQPNTSNVSSSRPEKENPDLNNHEEEDAKQTQLQQNTSNVSSSCRNNHEEEAKQTQLQPNTSNVSSSSRRSLELGHGDSLEENFGSSRLEPVSPFAWSMVSASPPPTELIGRSFSGAPSVDHDLNHKSAFSAVPSSPTGWSAVSNESLFSIHTGNNSFSRDHAFLYGKSGELRRLEEWCSQGIVPELDYNNGEAVVGSSGLPTVVEEGSVTPGKVSRVDSFDSRLSKASCEPGLEESGAGPPDPNTSPLDRNSVNLSNNTRFSEESGNSDRSFAFPVLVGEGMKTESLGGVTHIPEEPQLEEQVQGSSDNNKPSDRKKATGKRRFCCWPCTRRS